MCIRDSNSNVLKISATVGMQYPEITENAKAVLLEGFHSGTLNTDAVSYTHLRAHETKPNIVCRLLLEKKKI